MRLVLVTLFIFSLLLTSCSQKWYAKQCEKRFPITEKTTETIKYVTGKTDSFIQTITIDCDSAILHKKIDTSKTNKSHSFTIPCPPSTHRIDTIYSSTTIVKKDSAGIFLLSFTRDSLLKQCVRKDSQINEQKDKIKSQRSTILKFWIFILGIIVILIAYLGSKFYFKLPI